MGCLKSRHGRAAVVFRLGCVGCGGWSDRIDLAIMVEGFACPTSFHRTVRQIGAHGVSIAVDLAISRVDKDRIVHGPAVIGAPILAWVRGLSDFRPDLAAGFEELCVGVWGT